MIQIREQLPPLIHHQLEQPMTLSFKADRDPVTNVDTAIETVLRSFLSELTPDIPIVGEEFGGEMVGTYWFIDPIDGTVNYSTGSDNFATVLTLIQHEKPVLAYMYFPKKQGAYYAIYGGGCWNEDRRIWLHPSPISMSETIVGANDHLWIERPGSARTVELITQMMTDAYRVRMPGASCEETRQLLDGEAHMLLTHMSKWDLAGPLLMVGEAGGIVRNLESDDESLSSTERKALGRKETVEQFVQHTNRS